MKRLKILILLMLSSFCLLTMPVEAKALDFGNFAGDEDFSYDSNWQVEEDTTASSSGMTVQNCPHCGAHLNINQTAECPYCGCIITTDTFDWAISNITALSQQKK